VKFNSGYFMFAFQDEKDTPATTPVYRLRLLSGTSIGPDRAIQTKRTAEGERAADGISVIGEMGSGGTINFVAQPKNLTAILYAALGAIDSSGGSDPYSHAVTPDQDGKPLWITGWLQIDTINMMIPNLMINTLKVLVSSGDRLVVGQMELMGAGAVQYKTAGPAGAVTAEAVDKLFSWNMAKGTWELDGDTVGYIHTFELNINNNLTGIPGEDFFFYDIQEGPLDLDYAAVITIINASQYNNLIWGTETPSADAEPVAAIAMGSFSAKFTQAAASPGPECSFEIDVTESQYRNAVPKLQVDPDGKPQDLRLEARCTGTDPKITLTLKNAAASYAIGS
jgi:hypothetical protein